MSLSFAPRCILNSLISAAIALAIACPAIGQETTKLQLPGQPAATETKKVDPFVVPDGTPAELSKYIEGLSKLRPSNVDQASVLKFQKDLGAAVLKASDKILAGKPNPKQTLDAMRFKVGVFAMLMQMGDKGAVTELSDFATEIKKLSGSLPEVEKKLATKLARDAGSLLLIHELRRSATTGPEGLGKVVEKIEKHIGDNPQGMDFQLIMMVTQAAEMSRDDKLAAATYDHFSKLLIKNKEPRVAQMGRMFKAAARRLTLVGKTMKLEGETVVGKPFDWAGYRGKVVLLQFWATWCVPCRAETVNLMQNYKAYHERGFDVVGINVDKERSDLDKSLAQTKLPWTTIYDGIGKDSISTHYGIVALPTSILVGRDGKVISIRARGPVLEQDLKKLLGPTEEKKAANEVE